MILHALYNYYHRKAKLQPTIEPFGWMWKEIPYVIVIKPDATFYAIEETREKKRARKFLVPEAVKRTSNIEANLLWDTIEYALGSPTKRERAPAPEIVARQHEAFLNRIRTEVAPLNVESVNILLEFLNRNPVEQIEHSSYQDLWQAMRHENPFVVFRILGFNHQTICDDIRDKWPPAAESGGTMVCLITGNKCTPARLHQSIKGVRGANANGAALVSFNDPAYWSYGRTQSYNAPVSPEAAFAYTTAANILLDKDSRNKVALGDSITIAFWAEEGQPTSDFDLEAVFFFSFVDDRTDDPDAGVRAVQSLYQAISTGKLPSSQGSFYVLGLAPNAGRLSVRFFRKGPASLFAQHIYQHYEDLRIVHPPGYPEHPSLFKLLAATALNFDSVPKNLPGAVIERILDGTPYPDTLLQSCIRRIRATQSVSYYHAAILKAWLNRYHRLYHNLEKEITMALDPTNTTPAYLLGRLFAVLERIQLEAQPGINTTIRDRFFGAATSSPAATFPLLLKLSNYHLSKLDNVGRRINLERLIGDICASLQDFPRSLRLHEQALFALGYYHQRHSLYGSKSSPDTPNEASTDQPSAADISDNPQTA